MSIQVLYSTLTSCSRLAMTLVDSLGYSKGLVPFPIPLLVITPSWLVCICNLVYILDGLIKRIQFELPIDRNGELSDGKEKAVVTWRKRPLHAWSGCPKLGSGPFLQPHRPIYGHGKYSRGSSWLRRPSVRLTSRSGSGTNTNSSRKKCRVRL